MKTCNRLWVLLAALVLAGAPSVQAAISVGETGSGTNGFTATPAATEWSTLSWAGTTNDITDAASMDAAVSNLTASGIATTLGTSTTLPPSGNALARHNNSNPNGYWLQMRPVDSSNTKGCLLMATLTNTTGTGITKLQVSCLFSNWNNAAEELEGVRAYYSLTGLSNSWTVIPDLCVSASTASLSTTVTLSSAWASNTKMYVLWADDNASASTDDANAIDNVSFYPTETSPALANLLTFQWGNYIGLIIGTNVALTVPYGTARTNLNPTCSISANATVSPLSGSTNDFTNPVDYTIVSGDSLTTNVYHVTISQGAASGSIVASPPGLPVGTQYRLVFVTSNTTYSGGSSHGSNPPWFTHWSNYNDFATTAATAIPTLSSLGTTWKAVVSTGNPTIAAKTNTETDPVANGTGVPIYRLDGVLVAANNADLWDGSIAAPISVTQVGGLPPASTFDSKLRVWTGANADGSSPGATSALISQDGGYIKNGLATNTSAWICDNYANEIHTLPQPIYVMSGILTVQAPGSTNCEMLTFAWGSYSGVINTNAKTVLMHVPYGTDVTALNPTVTPSLSATVAPLSGSTNNFTSPVLYTITAENTSYSNVYTATVKADIPYVALSVDTNAISENGGVATVTATLSCTNAQDTTVNLAFSGTATLTTDYTRSGSNIVITAGNTNGSITLTAVNDGIYEGTNETIVVDISTVVNGLESNGVQQVTTTIVEQPAAEILALNWGSYTGAVNIAAKTVTLHIPHTNSLNPLDPNPTFALTAGATCDRTSGGAGAYYFTNSVTYTIISSDTLTTNAYTVTVKADIASPGEILPVPIGLAPGTQYRLVFVTSNETYSGGSDHGSNPPWFTSVADYDAFATTQATAVPSLNALNTTWKAVISTRSPNSAAKTNTGTDPAVTNGVPIYNLGGLIVATNNADLWDGTIANPINVNEYGGGPVAQRGGVPHYTVWTGASADGGNSGAGNALISQDGGYISVGRADATDSSWIAGLDSAGVDPNTRHTDAQPIYVISGILTVPYPPTVLSNAPVVTATGLVSQVDLNWTAVTNATGYSVRRSLSEVSGYSEIAALATTNYSDTGVTNGYLYWYIVAATNSASSSNSVAVSARPLPAAAPQPLLKGASGGFSLDPATGAARLTISNAMGGLKYRIVYTDDLLSDTWTPLEEEICTNNGTGLMTLLDTNAPAATQRFYKVESALP